MALERGLFNMSNLRDMLGIPTDDVENAQLTPADESMIFMAALRDECTPDEFDALVKESATEMELYGLIDTADIATEAQRNIVKLNKIAQFNRTQKRTAIRLAASAHDQLFEKYAKFRKLMIGYRLKIYGKYGNKAKSEARKIIANSRRKASSMNSASGKTITDKMDAQVKKFNDDKK